MAQFRRALIVDDDPRFRSKLRAVLERAYDVVGETDDSGEALACIVGREADLIVMDASRRPAGSRPETETDPPLAVLLVARPERGPLRLERPIGVRAYVRSASELGELTELLFGLAATRPPVA